MDQHNKITKRKPASKHQAKWMSIRKNDISNLPNRHEYSNDPEITGEDQEQSEYLRNSRLQATKQRNFAFQLKHIQRNFYLNKMIQSSPVSRNIFLRPIQRQMTGPEGNSETVIDPREQILAERIKNKLQAGELTLAVYVAQLSTVKQHGAFLRQATQYALDHRTVGIRDGKLQEGAAMELNESLPTLLVNLQSKIENLLQRYYPHLQNQSIPIRIQTLAIFTHGLTEGLQAGDDAHWVGTSQAIARKPRQRRNWVTLSEWVDGISSFLSSSPQIIQYACSVSGDSPIGMSFSEALRLALQEELSERYGASESSPEVWGHTVPGHTTRNAMIATNTTNGSETFKSVLSSQLAKTVIENAGGETSLSARQLNRVRQLARSFAGPILRVEAGAERSRRNPINTFIREIPQLGLSRAVQIVASEATPDLSDLNLTDDARERVVQGSQALHERFQHQVERIARQL